MKWVILSALLCGAAPAFAGPIGSAAGGTIGSGAGGTIGSGAGGRRDQTPVHRGDGSIRFVDSQTGEQIDLSVDRFVQVANVVAYRLCESNPCEVQATSIDLDGSSFSLSEGRYVFEYGPSFSDVIEVRKNESLSIPLARLQRPSKVAEDRAALVVPFLNSSAQAERSRVLALTGRRGQGAQLSEEFRRSAWLVPEQKSAYVFPGRYSIGYRAFIASLLTPHEWIHDVPAH